MASSGLQSEASPPYFNPKGIASYQPKGCRVLASPARTEATLIGVPKLFASGEESCREGSAQPMVNNFAARTRGFCEQDCRCAGRHAVTPRWMTNELPVSSDEFTQSFAPAAALGLKTNTQMPTVGCLRYKAFAEPKPACPQR